jgi:PAS domain-containing protein
MTPATTAPEAAAERLRLLLESTGEGIFGIDLAGRCTFVNRAVAQMLPCRIDDEVLWRADGSPFWAEYSICPIDLAVLFLMRADGAWSTAEAAASRRMRRTSAKRRKLSLAVPRLPAPDRRCRSSRRRRDG